jgi:DNA-directed RNA polymerase subunit RPC12/RpoP
MGTIRCPKCGEPIIDDIEECPYCFSRTFPKEEPDIELMISDLVDALNDLPPEELQEALCLLQKTLTSLR